MNRREGVDQLVTIGEWEQLWRDAAATFAGARWWDRVDEANRGVEELRNGFTTTAAVIVGERP